MTFLRRAKGLALAMMLVPPAMADDRAPPNSPLPKPGPLTPGKAAGVGHAQTIRSGIALVAGGGVIAVVVLAVSTGGGSNSSANPQNNSVTVSSGTN